MFCSIIKILFSSALTLTPALAAHFDFSSFSSRPFSSSWPPFFYTQGVFGLDTTTHALSSSLDLEVISDPVLFYA